MAGKGCRYRDVDPKAWDTGYANIRWGSQPMQDETPKVLVFNTRRDYSEHGHRIACQAIDGGVFLVDVDRNIDGFFEATPLTVSSIMEIYDNTWKKNRVGWPPSMRPSKEDAYDDVTAKLESLKEMIEKLTKLAKDLS